MRLRRFVATSVSALLVLGVAAPASAAAASGTAACPATISDDEFDDVNDGTAHEHAIDCVAWWGITTGGANGRYGAGALVTRGQIASFLARTLTYTGADLPATPRMPYSDVPSGTTHRLPIAQLASVGVLRPAAGDEYRPGAALTRADMAVFLFSAHAHRTGRATTPATERFSDVTGHRDRDAINAAAELGFTTGFADGTYGPSGTVTRAQMASFLTRVLDVLVDDRVTATPASAAWGGVPPGRARYLPLPTAPPDSYALTDAYWLERPVPVRWNPCRPVPVVVDYAGAPSGAERAVKDAIGKVAFATGLKFSYTDRSGLRRSGPMVDGPDGVLLIDWPVTWEGPPAWVLGVGGTSYTWDAWVTAGSVSIHPSAPLSRSELTSLLMHEIGHAVGLQHPNERGHVMATGNLHRTEWTAGDLAGLARVGRGAGCAPQPYTDGWNPTPTP